MAKKYAKAVIPTHHSRAIQMLFPAGRWDSRASLLEAGHDRRGQVRRPGFANPE